jgi:hypothetical protein
MKYPLADGIGFMKGVFAFFRFFCIGVCLLILFGQDLNSETVYIQPNKWVVLLIIGFILFITLIMNMFTSIALYPKGIRIWFDIWSIAIRWDEIVQVYLVKTIPLNEFYFITTSRKLPLSYTIQSLFFIHKNEAGFVLSSRHQGASEIIGKIYQHTGITILELDD